MLERSAGLRSCRDLWAECHWQGLSREGIDVTQFDGQQAFTYSDIQIFYPFDR